MCRGCLPDHRLPELDRRKIGVIGRIYPRGGIAIHNAILGPATDAQSNANHYFDKSPLN
jgi:hypothetical protein